jgi:hypothetical protein
MCVQTLAVFPGKTQKAIIAGKEFHGRRSDACARTKENSRGLVYRYLAFAPGMDKTKRRIGAIQSSSLKAKITPTIFESWYFV